MLNANETMSCPGRNRPGNSRQAKLTLNIDMTPMVDLGFLLISFFVITTQLSKPSAMDLFMPADGPPTDQGISNALTVLLDKDNAIYYYHGDWETAVSTRSIFQTNYSGRSGLRRVIEEKQKFLDLSKPGEGRKGLMLLIKPANGSTYKNVVDVLDEAVISMVKKYALVTLTTEEIDWLSRWSGGG